MFALAKRHRDATTLGYVRLEPDGELVSDAVRRDTAGVPLADDRCRQCRHGHADERDRRKAPLTGRPGRSPLPEEGNQPRPAGTDRDRGQDREPSEVPRVEPEARRV